MAVTRERDLAHADREPTGTAGGAVAEHDPLDPGSDALRNLRGIGVGRVEQEDRDHIPQGSDQVA